MTNFLLGVGTTLLIFAIIGGWRILQGVRAGRNRAS
jgi:hypothetical protein